jgi:hypothetical protein
VNAEIQNYFVAEIIQLRYLATAPYHQFLFDNQPQFDSGNFMVSTKSTSTLVNHYTANDHFNTFHCEIIVVLCAHMV